MSDESGARADHYHGHSVPELVEAMVFVWLFSPLTLALHLLGIAEFESGHVFASVVGTALWALIIGATVITHV